VQIAINDRGTQTLGQCLAFFNGIRHDDATTRNNDREFGGCQQGGGFVQAGFATGTTIQTRGLGDFTSDLAIEVVTGNVELGWSHFAHRPIKTTTGVFSHPGRVGDMALVFGEFLEHWQLVAFLETTQTHGAGAGFRVMMTTGVCAQ
jgi:hypothetical protein